MSDGHMVDHMHVFHASKPALRAAFKSDEQIPGGVPMPAHQMGTGEPTPPIPFHETPQIPPK